MKKKVLSIVLIFTLLQGLLYSVFAATQSELEQQQKELENQKQQVEEQKEDVDDQLDEQLKEIANLDNAITSSENEISNLTVQIENIEASIQEKEKEIEQKQKEYEENEELLDERLVVMYETGETSFLDLLFSSSNLVDFLSNYYSLSQLAECDMDLLESIENDKNEIERAKETLESQKNEIVNLKSQKQIKATQLKNQKTEREQKANSLSESQKQLQSEIDSYNTKIKEVENAVAEAIAKAMREEEERKRQEAQNGGSSTTTNGNGSSFDGTFAWPLDYSPRRVTSRMYYRTYNGVTRWHKGIDIGTNAETGKRVIAAASGTVIYKAYQSGTTSNPGYGNYVIIYHGNGFATLYAHMNSASVSTGQKVTQGQTVGYSGNTGGVAPHLHFEIRKASSVGNFFGSNNWLDPLDYLPGGYTIVS